MKRIFLAVVMLGVLLSSATSCKQNQAAEAKTISTKDEKNKISPMQVSDGPAVGSIETGNYVMKLHKAFLYDPKKDDDLLANTRPKQGYRFVYLDVSLKNKGTEPVDGGQLMIALKVKDDKGNEYRKPAVALAVYCSENPGAQNKEEYNALWEKFHPGDFHRAIIYAVEVPVGVNNFTLTIPVDKKRKEWRDIKFSV